MKTIQSLSRKAFRKAARKAKSSPTCQSTLQSTATSSTSSAPSEKEKKRKSNSKSKSKKKRKADISDSDDDDGTSQKRKKGSSSYSPSSSSVAAQRMMSVAEEENLVALRLEEAEIARLEANLFKSKKGKGGDDKEKAKKKLHKEFEKYEGFGEGFGAFLDELDGLEEDVLGGGGGEFDEDEDDDFMFGGEQEEEGEGEGEGEEGGEEEDVLDYSDDDDDSDNDNDKIDILSTDDEESESDTETEPPQPKTKTKADRRGPTYTPSLGEDIYGRSTAHLEQATTKKYVPPHLRGKVEEPATTTATSSATLSAQPPSLLLKQITSLLNRLSPSLLHPTSVALSTLYKLNSKSDVSSSLLAAILPLLKTSKVLLTSIVPSIAAVVGVLVKGDSDLGGWFAEALVGVFEESRLEVDETDSNSDDDDDDDDNNNVVTSSSNIVLLISYLYNFGVLHVVYIYDLIRDLVTSFTPSSVDLLLIVLNHSGGIIKGDDMEALGEIVNLVKRRAIENSKNDSNDGDNNNNSRFQYALNSIAELNSKKGRRHTSAQIIDDNVRQLRKSVRHVWSQFNNANMKKGEENSSSQSLKAVLRISMKDVKNIDVKGRWWKVGGVWLGGEGGGGGGGGASDEEKEKVGNFDSQLLKNNRLSELASTLRMNTPTRRSIFYIIMSSSDYIDCSNKLTRMNLRGKEPREIVRVLATCCGSEGKYNEYYSHLAGRIIEEDEGAKFTFQLTFWDMFKQFGEMELRKASNLARLLSSLVIGRGVGMNVLKVVAFEEIEEEASAVFFTVFFKSLFDEVGELEVEALFSDLREDLREGVRLFFDRYLKNCDSNKKGGKGNGNGGRGNKDWRRKFKKAVKILGKHRERGADELSVGDGGVARGDEDEEENGGRAYNDDDWD